jgi:hypothetical protein
VTLFNVVGFGTCLEVTDGRAGEHAGRFAATSSAKHGQFVRDRMGCLSLHVGKRVIVGYMGITVTIGKREVVWFFEVIELHSAAVAFRRLSSAFPIP